MPSAGTQRMTKPVHQSVLFRARPEDLFDIYLDSKKHSASTGAPARMSRKVGGTFTAWGGQLRGRNLLIIPGADDRPGMAGNALETDGSRLRPGAEV